MKAMILCFLVAVFILSPGVTPAAEKQSLKQTFKLPGKAIVIIHTASYEKSLKDPSVCRDFSKLTESQVREFFASYHLLDGKELHDNYVWGPCWISGLIEIEKKKYSWKARIGNTLETDFPDGKMKTLGGAPTDGASN